VVEAVVGHEDGEVSEADAAEEVEEVSERVYGKPMGGLLNGEYLRLRPTTPCCISPV
jgi:hypothetical protein